MDLPNVNPGELIKAADINNLSSGLEYLETSLLNHASQNDAVEESLRAELPTTVASSALSYVVTDRNGRMSWLQADLDGAPTDDALRAVGVARSVNPTVAWTVTDSQNRMSVLAIGHDGRLTPDSAMEISEDLATHVRRDRLVHTIGHSFTSNGTLADYIAAQLGSGWTGTTSGVGGETSQGIAARAGAAAWMFHPIGGSIPASGDVDVSLDLGGHGPDVNAYWPLLWNGAGTTHLGTGQDNDNTDGIRGTLAGVPGTLRIARPAGTAASVGHLSGDRYYFRRNASGVTVPCKRAIFRPTYVATQLGGVVVIMAAQNNIIELDRVMFNFSAIIDTIPHDRVIVVGEWNASTAPPGTTIGDAVIAFNKAAADRWGARFVDVRDYARRYGLSDAGITPTSGDNTDIAAGVIPRTLRRDDIHPTQASTAGYMALARPIAERITALGWT